MAAGERTRLSPASTAFLGGGGGSAVGGGAERWLQLPSAIRQASRIGLIKRAIPDDSPVAMVEA
jgi:hypothetical protein